MDFQERVRLETRGQLVDDCYKQKESEVAQSCPTLCDPMDCSQAPPSMGFSRQEY